MEQWQSIRHLSVAPNVKHVQAWPTDDDEEDWDDIGDLPDFTENLPTIAGISCIIEYGKANGEQSQRVVTCQRLDDHAGTIYLWAYCHLRTQKRQFRVDRIIAVFDVETGEEHASPISFFSNYRADVTHASQPGWGLSVRRRSDFLALLNVLVFLARCDREYHPLERAALEQIVATCWMRMEYPGDPDIASILAHIDRLAPDAETFWIAMHRCATSPLLLVLLHRAARQMVDADGKVTDEEFYWGSRIDEFASELLAGRGRTNTESA